MEGDYGVDTPGRPERAAMGPEVTDKLLVEAARRGDRDAFALLVVRHRPLLLRLCERALGDVMLAEDAAQDAVLHAFLSLDRLRRPERFGSWLAGIGLNICRRWRGALTRRDWSWDALVGGQRVSELIDGQPGPEAVVEGADLRAQVHHAVAGLPSGQRAAVLLFYLEGFTHAETAALLEIETGAVKTRLHKARAALRRQLLAEWKEHPMDEKLSRRTLTKGVGAVAGMAAAAKLAPSAAAEEQFVTMRIGDVRRFRVEDVPNPQRHVIVLEEIQGERVLPIWIGEFEASAIALQLEKVQTPRPMAYALTANILAAVGGRVREVRISKLVGDVFYAEVVVEGRDGVQSLDARPSDALNLALLTEAPIRVDPSVLSAPKTRDDMHWQGEGVEDAAAIVAAKQADWSQYAPSAAQPAQTE